MPHSPGSLALVSLAGRPESTFQTPETRPHWGVSSAGQTPAQAEAGEAVPASPRSPIMDNSAPSEAGNLSSHLPPSDCEATSLSRLPTTELLL